MGKTIDFKHLKTAKQSYLPHGFFAIKWGIYLMITGLVSVIHGIFPFLWPFVAPRNVLKVARMIEQRGEDQLIASMDEMSSESSKVDQEAP